MSEGKQKAYRVLARKYRSRNFDELIGQDAVVRTLKNAIASGRIAHAFMLTGVRGVGKTSIARIIAKALNYAGPDGKAGPTTGPTDDCEICQAITEDRHPDVMEMDAASRTGIDDIREILDGVRYAPTSARYKVYIIDEVHMLSKQAFNALLKTLEEPPEHVIFIFATTEIRKVPVTVLSRCQRFDLRRVDVPTLIDHYREVCTLEKVKAEDEALALIARAADGSVRDGMSLLDQAIAMEGEKITAPQIQDMLGLADKAKIMDVLEHGLKGDCAQALGITEDLYRSGADPLTLMQDMLDFTHLLTKLKAVPGIKETHTAVAQDTLERSADLAAKLSMPSLGRAWQILLKGIGEVNTAPNPQAAAEMIIIRLAYAADLPDPADLIKKLKDQKEMPANNAPPVPVPSRQREPVTVAVASGGGGGSAAAVAMPQPQSQPQPQPVQTEKLETLQDIVSLLESHREVILAGQVYHYIHLVSLQPGRLEVHPEPAANPALTQDLRKFLLNVTGDQWMVSISGTAGQPTLAELNAQTQATLLDEAKKNPVVQEVLKVFPGTDIKIIEEQ